MIHIKIVTEQTRNKISNTSKGHTVSDKTKRSISNSLKGKPGHKHSEETKRKISKTRTGQKHSDEAKRKMSLNNQARDPEVRKKMSQSHTGHIPWNKGKTGIYSKEALEKMSLSHLGQPAYWKGKQLTEKAKQKISETKKKNHTQHSSKRIIHLIHYMVKKVQVGKAALVLNHTAQSLIIN